MNKLLQDFTIKLIQEKENLNDEINDVIYADLEKALNIKDLEKINTIKKEISIIYDIIEYIDEKYENIRK
jgi:hypothetical protein